MIDYVPAHRPPSVWPRSSALCARAASSRTGTPARVEEAYRAAHRLACEEWSMRQFIGGPASPSPPILNSVSVWFALRLVRFRLRHPDRTIGLAVMGLPTRKARLYFPQVITRQTLH